MPAVKINLSFAFKTTIKLNKDFKINTLDNNKHLRQHFKKTARVWKKEDEHEKKHQCYLAQSTGYPGRQGQTKSIQRRGFMADRPAKFGKINTGT